MDSSAVVTTDPIAIGIMRRKSLYAIGIMLDVRGCFVFAYAIRTELNEGFFRLDVK